MVCRSLWTRQALSGALRAKFFQRTKTYFSRARPDGHPSCWHEKTASQRDTALFYTYGEALSKVFSARGVTVLLYPLPSGRRLPPAFSQRASNSGKGGAAPAPGISTTPELSSSDESMQKLYDFAKQIAAADSGVLITGETGTGKSVLAKYIHENSPRSKKKFVELNCAAIPESLIESELFGYETGAFTGAQKGGKPGLFEAADGGTLFLDEIGDMPLQLQPKLLHALQNKTITRVGGTRQIPVNVRIITATNKNLENLVKEGLFRNDLYYRINIVPISIPPLRERKSDITPLINSFVDRFNKHYNQSAAIDDGAMKLLNLYKWPGNIRELENMIERLLVTNKSGIITEWDLPNNIRIMTDSDDDSGIHVSKLMPLKDALETVEGELVRMAFKDGASTYDVARKLKISQSGASRKYLKYVKNAPLSD